MPITKPDFSQRLPKYRRRDLVRARILTEKKTNLEKTEIVPSTFGFWE